MTRFDPQRSLRWLAASTVQDDGAVLSWVNPEHPGFTYPEAAAVVLRLLRDVGAAEFETVAARIARRLRADVENRRVGKAGRRFPFDLGVSLAALCEEERAFVAELHESVLADLSDDTSFDPIDADGGRWSTIRGPHLLKLAIGLHRAATRLDCAPRLDELSALSVDQAPDGRIASPPHPATYVHAHCYAAEGLLALAQAQPQRTEHRRRGTAAAAWLATIQRADGSLPAWHDGRDGSGPGPSDTCAQAVRLWCLVDRDGYADPIERALAYLGSLSSPGGGVRYNDASDDLNTWATAFAVQAALWADRGAGSPLTLL